MQSDASPLPGFGVKDWLWTEPPICGIAVVRWLPRRRESYPEFVP